MEEKENEKKNGWIGIAAGIALTGMILGIIAGKAGLFRTEETEAVVQDMGQSEDNAQTTGGEEAFDRQKEKTSQPEDELPQSKDKLSQPILDSVTYEEGEDMGEPITLHFAFSDKTTVDYQIESDDSEGAGESWREINISYIDVTDNDIKVVLVRVWHWYVRGNTIDKCTVIYLYQVRDKVITDISPEMERLAGRSGSLWSAEVSDNSVDGYMLLLEMTSFNVDSADAVVMTVGYGMNGWETLKSEKLSDWRALYLQYLQDRIQRGENVEEWRFRIVYIDDNELPELLYGRSGAERVSLLTIKNGEVKEYADCVAVAYGSCYLPRENCILNITNILGDIRVSRCFIEEGGLQTEFLGGSSKIRDEGIQDDVVFSGVTWEWYGEQLSGQEEFLQKLNEYRDVMTAFWDESRLADYGGLVDTLSSED